jgi:TRAP-type mannitol/chloroaromatic compound transport system permease small subunit
MGYCYVVNAHPRVDSYTDRLPFRRKAWIELVGCVLFAIPYTAVLLWYGWDFVRTAWVFNEASDAALGLPWRWIPKGILYLGFWLILVGVVSVLLRLIAFLFFRQEAGLRIGSSVSQV